MQDNHVWHQPPTLTGVSLPNFWRINRCKDIRDDEMSATENHPTALSTHLGAKPTDTRDDISMFDDSVPNPHKRESTDANT